MIIPFMIYVVNQSNSMPVSYIELSEKMMESLMNQEDVAQYQKILANAKWSDIRLQLNDDEKRMVFWLNIYNANIQVQLSDAPGRYEEKNEFFNAKSILIAGDLLSFADIEHGILRKSQHPYGMGYFKKCFPPALEKSLRVNKPDYRIHFALNCGAKSCPPVRIYHLNTLQQQLQEAEAFFVQQTEYDEKTNTATISSIFFWFRGDFGGKKGIREILHRQKVIPDKSVFIKSDNYNWTLQLAKK